MAKLFGLVALLGAVSAQNVNTSLPTVDLGYEIYRAAGFNETGGFYNFSNIRYAAPPVGELRFAPPKAPAKNRDTIQNGDVGRFCPQASPAWGQLAQQALAGLLLGVKSNTTAAYVPPGANASSPLPPADPRESEDCLFLDVFVPEKIFESANASCNGDAPVLVWIYGGGYVNGNKNLNPAGLLAASGEISNGEVILVAMNYRLGALGWLSGPSFQAEGGASNAGLLDQRFALEWIQENIHKFGGNKDRVTIFGESAGGGSIMHQITAYGGLKGKVPFQQAVPQSPGWLPIQSNIQKEDLYTRFLNLTNSTSLSDLRALSSEEIIRASAQQVTYDSPYGSFTYGPVVDGVFAPLSPGELLAQGRFDKNLTVMVGHNANEGAYFTPINIKSQESLVQQLRGTYAYTLNRTIEFITEKLYPSVFDGSYPYNDDLSRANLIVSESAFTCNTNFLSTAFGNKTYSYLFAVPPAFHGLDVPYTFFTGGSAGTSPLGVTNRTIAIALQEFITSFAITGKPEAEGIRQFNMYGPDASVLELNITGIEEVRDSNANERCNWWQKALY